MTDGDWPSEWPDPDKIKKGEKSAWDAPDDWPKGKKGKGGEREQRLPKEKVPATWGRAFFDEYEGRGKKHKGGRGGPVDKQALKQQRDDAKWAAKQQRAIAKANEREARDTRKAAVWQERADREIARANANQKYQQASAAMSDAYGQSKQGDGRASGDGCGCIFTSVSGWFVLFLLALLLLDILINS